MPRALSPIEAARILARFDKERNAATIVGFNRGLNGARRRAITVYMQGLGRGAGARAANPPPGPLGIRTGALRRTVGIVPAQRTKDGWTGGLKAGGNGVDYARIHELGGKTKAHVILPKNKRALRFTQDMMGPVRPSRGATKFGLGPGVQGPTKPGKVKLNAGKQDVFAMRVNHPGSKIPARPYMTPALTDSQGAIAREVEVENQRLILRLFR